MEIVRLYSFLLRQFPHQKWKALSKHVVILSGLSTQPIWYKLWCDIMKTRPSRLKVS